MRTHPIEILRDGFNFASRGPAFVIQGVYDCKNAPLDLLAWQVTKPHHTRQFLGDGAILGAHNAVTSGHYPLQVHKTPLSWLRADCTGIFIVSATNARKVLGRYSGQLIAEDLSHAKALAAALAPAVNSERIVIPRLRVIPEAA